MEAAAPRSYMRVLTPASLKTLQTDFAPRQQRSVVQDGSTVDTICCGTLAYAIQEPRCWFVTVLWACDATNSKRVMADETESTRLLAVSTATSSGNTTVTTLTVAPLSRAPSSGDAVLLHNGQLVAASSGVGTVRLALGVQAVVLGDGDTLAAIVSTSSSRSNMIFTCNWDEVQ